VDGHKTEFWSHQHLGKLNTILWNIDESRQLFVVGTASISDGFRVAVGSVAITHVDSRFAVVAHKRRTLLVQINAN